MARPKKELESTSENLVENTVTDILHVSDKITGIVLKIDANKEKDWKTKYNHRSGKPFNE